MKSEYRWTSTERVLSSSICPPGVRLVALQLWVDDEGKPGDEEVLKHPVPAIRSTVRRRFTRRFRPADYPPHGIGPGDAGTEKELIEGGWTLEGQTESIEALAVIDGCLQPTDELRCENCIVRLVACDWPSHEDGEKLKPFIDEILQQEAPDLLRRCREATLRRRSPESKQ